MLREREHAHGYVSKSNVSGMDRLRLIAVPIVAIWKDARCRQSQIYSVVDMRLVLHALAVVRLRITVHGRSRGPLHRLPVHVLLRLRHTIHWLLVIIPVWSLRISIPKLLARMSMNVAWNKALRRHRHFGMGLGSILGYIFLDYWLLPAIYFGSLPRLRDSALIPGCMG